MICASMQTLYVPHHTFAVAFALTSCACQPAQLDPSEHQAAGHVPAHDTDQPAHQRGRGYIPELPFVSGDIDFFDLAAIYAGAPFEGRCSPFPEGTWRNVAAQMREQFNCEPPAPEAVDPTVSADLAACANELFSVGLRSACSDLSAFGGYQSPSCDASWSAYGNRYSYCPPQ
jgi:hypothetical protein